MEEKDQSSCIDPRFNFDLKKVLSDIESAADAFLIIEDKKNDDAFNMIFNVIKLVDYISQSIYSAKYLAMSFSKYLNAKKIAQSDRELIIRTFICFIPSKANIVMGECERICFAHLWYFFFYHAIQANLISMEGLVSILEEWPFGEPLDVETLLILFLWFHKDIDLFSPSLTRRLTEIAKAMSTPLLDTYKTMIPPSSSNYFSSILQILSFSEQLDKSSSSVVYPLPEVKSIAISLLKGDDEIDYSSTYQQIGPPAVIISSKFGKLIDVIGSSAIVNSFTSETPQSLHKKTCLYAAFLGLQELYTKCSQSITLFQTDVVFWFSIFCSHCIPMMKEVYRSKILGFNIDAEINKPENKPVQEILCDCYKYKKSESGNDDFSSVKGILTYIKNEIDSLN